MSNNLTDEIYDIAVETFELMCFMFPLDESEVPETESFSMEKTNIAAMITFDGATQGGMVLRVSRNLRDAIAVNMMGDHEASWEQKDGALCEMVNIIGGNTVPSFGSNGKNCHIRPPRIMEPLEDPDVLFRGMKRESVCIYLDEGTAEITVYYFEF